MHLSLATTPAAGSPTPGAALTMSSREIADLVGSRHDSVKRTMERLAEKGVVAFTATQEKSSEGFTPTVEKSSGGRPGTVFHVNKRDSFVVVAQLCPEFTARLVDRWQQLEEEKANGIFQIPRTLGDALQLAADQARQIEAMRDDVAALDRIAAADGSMCITDAAKALQIRPKVLFSYLQSNGWIYRRPGGSGWIGYQSKLASAVLEHKVTTVLRADGTEKVTEQVRVTPKGLTRLAKLISPAASMSDGGSHD